MSAPEIHQQSRQPPPKLRGARGAIMFCLVPPTFTQRVSRWSIDDAAHDGDNARSEKYMHTT